jgi:hypothetical protein
MTVLNASGRVVVMACAINALSYESSSWGGGHGQFTWHYFVQGMDNRYADSLTDADTVVSVEEAFDYAKARCASQTPVIADGFTNDLLP